MEGDIGQNITKPDKLISLFVPSSNIMKQLICLKKQRVRKTTFNFFL